MFGVILVYMLFCHVVDDYYLQGHLANMKQRSWWFESGYCDVFEDRQLYKYDYLMALLMHSFSWAFMIQLPVLIWFMVEKHRFTSYFILLVVNLLIHFVVDHFKANLHKINLITDQVCHICQVVFTWILLIVLK